MQVATTPIGKEGYIYQIYELLRDGYSSLQESVQLSQTRSTLSSFS